MTRQGVNIKKNKRSKANATSVVTQQQSDLVMPKQHLVLNNQLVQRKVSNSFNTISSKQTSYNTKQQKFNGLLGFPIQQKKEEAPSEEKEHRIQEKVVSNSENTSKKTGKEKGKTAKGAKNKQDKPPKKEEEKQPEEPSKEGEEKETVATATPSTPPPSKKKNNQPPQASDKEVTNPKGSLPNLNSKSMQQATKFTFDMPASKMSAQFPAAGAHFEKSFKATRQGLSTLPPLHATLDGSKVPPAPKTSTTFKTTPLPKLDPVPAPKMPNKNPKTPTFQPAKGGNPKEITAIAQQQQQALKAQETTALQGINELSTDDKIIPKSFATTKPLKILPSKTSIKDLKVSPELTDYANKEMPDSLRASIDTALEPTLKMKSPKDKLKAGLKEKDQAYQEQYKAAEKKIKNESEQATTEQKKLIEDSRKELEARKQAAMKEAQDMAKDATGKISEARKKQLEKVNAKIAEGEKKASDKQDAADAEVVKINKKRDKDVAAEQKKAKKQEKEARRKNGKTAQKKSGKPIQRWWNPIKAIKKGWNKAVKAVKSVGKSIWNGIKKAVSKIASALKKAVKGIVSLAKKAVKGVIAFAAKAIKGIVKGIQSVVKGIVKIGAGILKGIVNTVFSAFPGIKNKLNGWIDKGVNKINNAVDKIANKINSTVDSLKETLDSAVDAAANFVENLALMAIEVAEAGLTGNLGKIPEIMFKRACESIGLPGEELLMILRKAKSKFHIILKKTGVFFGNLGTAVKNGFKRFVKNIGKHIKQGLMKLLLGDAAEGVAPPSDLSFGSIFKFIRQVLGVGDKQIQERAKEQLGDEQGEGQPAQAKTIQRSLDPQAEGQGGEQEQQGGGGGGFAGFMKFFTNLLSKGPKAVWKFFEQYAGNIIDSILDGIVDMVTQTVIQKAIEKVISFLIPGAGWLAAIMSAWKFLKFLKQAILQIALFVNQVLDNLEAIMESKLTFVADLLEQALSAGIKMVFKFFSNLLGLGKIGSKVSKIIMKVRKPVVKAVDKVIGTFRKFGINLIPEEEPEGEGAVHDDGDPNGEGHPNNGMGGFSSQEEMMQYMQMRQMVEQRQQMMMMQMIQQRRQQMQQMMMAQQMGGQQMGGQGEMMNPAAMQQMQMQQLLAQQQMQQMQQQQTGEQGEMMNPAAMQQMQMQQLLAQQQMQQMQQQQMQQQMMTQEGTVQQKELSDNRKNGKNQESTIQQRSATFNQLFPKRNRLLLQKRDYNSNNYNHASDNSEAAILTNLYG